MKEGRGSHAKSCKSPSERLLPPSTWKESLQSARYDMGTPGQSGSRILEPPPLWIVEHPWNRRSFEKSSTNTFKQYIVSVLTSMYFSVDRNQTSPRRSLTQRRLLTRAPVRPVLCGYAAIHRMGAQAHAPRPVRPLHLE